MLLRGITQSFVTSFVLPCQFEHSVHIQNRTLFVQDLNSEHCKEALGTSDVGCRSHVSYQLFAGDVATALHQLRYPCQCSLSCDSYFTTFMKLDNFFNFFKLIIWSLNGQRLNICCELLFFLFFVRNTKLLAETDCL